MKINYYSRALALVFLVLCAVGCSKNPCVPVTGQVLLDGQPLEGASVIFSPVEAGPEIGSASAVTDADGNFELKSSFSTTGIGAVPGDYKVLVKKVEGKWDGTTTPNPGGEEIKNMSTTDLLPKVYGRVGSTPLSATVTPDGKNHVVLEISMKP